MQVTPTLTLFKHSKGKSPFHHATFRLLLYIAVKISISRSRYRADVHGCRQKDSFNRRVYQSFLRTCLRTPNPLFSA
jgi:hypothetical protein